MTRNVMRRKLNIQEIHQPKMCKVMGGQLNPNVFAEYTWHLIPAAKG
jgi:menaquinone-dependent protoporphyrinogen IX oxidase